MKSRFVYFLSLFFAISLTSCTLVLDDLALPEDQLGFAEPHTIESSEGYCTYQFTDNVKNIADNVLPYINRIEADSIIWYLETIPEEYVPKVGEIVYAPVSRTIYRGLANEVLQVDRVGGMIRVTTTPSKHITEIFDTVEFDYSVEHEMQGVVAKTKEEIEELGIPENQLCFVDWTLYDEQHGSSASSQRMSRGDGDTPDVNAGNVGEWEKVEPDPVNGSKRATIIDIDTRHAIKSQILDDYFSFFKESTPNQPSSETKPYVRIKIEVDATIKANVKGRERHVTPTDILTETAFYDVDMTIYPTFYYTIEMGWYNGSTNTCTKFDEATKAWLAKQLTAASKKFTDKKVEFKAGELFAVINPAVSLYLRPSMTFKWYLGGGGGFTFVQVADPIVANFTSTHSVVKISEPGGKTILSSPFVITPKEDQTSKFKDTRNKDKLRSESIAEAGIDAWFEIGGGIETGVRVLQAVDLGVYAGVSLRIEGELRDKTSIIEDKKVIGTYIAENQRISLKPSFSVEGRATIARTNLCVSVPIVSVGIGAANGFTKYICPHIYTYNVSEKKENEYKYLKGCTININIDDTGIYYYQDSFKNNRIGIVFTDEKSNKVLYVAQCENTLKRGDNLIKCSFDPKLFPDNKICAYPVLILTTGYMRCFEDKMFTIDTDLGDTNATFKIKTMQQVIGAQIKDLSYADQSKIFSLYAGEEFTDDWYLFQMGLAVNVVFGTIPVREWGLYLTELSYSVGTGNVISDNRLFWANGDKDKYKFIPVYKSTNADSFRGTKYVKFSFISNMDIKAYIDYMNQYEANWNETYRLHFGIYFKYMDGDEYYYTPPNNEMVFEYPVYTGFNHNCTEVTFSGSGGMTSSNRRMKIK